MASAIPLGNALLDFLAEHAVGFRIDPRFLRLRHAAGVDCVGRAALRGDRAAFGIDWITPVRSCKLGCRKLVARFSRQLCHGTSPLMIFGLPAFSSFSMRLSCAITRSVSAC